MSLAFLIPALLHDAIWGGWKRLPLLPRRLWAALLLFVPFFLVFGWKAAGVVTFGALLRRYKGWRPPWLNEVILHMSKPVHVVSMFVLSLCLLVIPALGHFVLGLPLMAGVIIYVMLAALIALTYWMVIGLLGKSHHIAEILTGIYITAFSAWYFTIPQRIIEVLP